MPTLVQIPGLAWLVSVALVAARLDGLALAHANWVLHVCRRVWGVVGLVARHHKGSVECGVHAGEILRFLIRRMNIHVSFEICE
jgi:hypothetical protein